MRTTTIFKPTAIQRKALALLKSGAKYILLFGGSRSGKTTVLVMAVIYRALRFPSSRHLICRYRAKDARSSVLRETLFLWLNNTVGKGGYRSRDEFSICNVPANPFALAKVNNEQLERNNESGVSAVPFWNGLINNFEGA